MGTGKMTLHEYQELAMRTHVAGPTNLPAYTLGLAGESGEVADLVKKFLGHGHGLDLTKVSKELGDVLWYVAGLANVLGLSLSDIAEQNIAKLQARYPEGFTEEASKNRVV